MNAQYFGQKKMNFFKTLTFLVLVMAACNTNDDALIQRKVAEKVAEFEKETAESCKNELFATIDKMVDSILLTEATGSLSDSLARLKPGKPGQPADIPAIDSAAVQPIFKGALPASSTRRR